MPKGLRRIHGGGDFHFRERLSECSFAYFLSTRDPSLCSGFRLAAQTPPNRLNFITCSCYRRLALLKSARRRNIFLEILEQVRKKYRFIVAGYVVMPEHFHLLMSEPEQGTPSTVMQVLKQRVTRRLLPKRKRRDSRQAELFSDEHSPKFWQSRFYDFNVYSKKKHAEKLRYMHHNPVKRGLVDKLERWEWSSYLDYAEGRKGVVKLN